MCKIITIINKNKHNTSTLNKLLRANAEDLSREKDGYAVYEFDKGKGERRVFVGTEAYNNISKNIEYNGGEIYMVHFRTKTSGESGEEGLHLDKIQDRYVYAHNGTASKFSGKKTKSDSHHFFEELLSKELNIKNINSTINESNFWGRAFLFDEKENRLHIFCNSFVQIYALKDCLVFSSYALEMKPKDGEIKIILGLPLTTKESKEIQIIGESEMVDEYITFLNGSFETDHFLDNYYQSEWEKELEKNRRKTFWNPETNTLEEVPLFHN